MIICRQNLRLTHGDHYHFAIPLMLFLGIYLACWGRSNLWADTLGGMCGNQLLTLGLHLQRSNPQSQLSFPEHDGGPHGASLDL